MEIGKLEKISPRTIWKGEAIDFTPWLAKEENIERLSEEIGIELEVISEEKSVGPFRADILCKSMIDNSYVLIENQLEKTDHTHLGQLITYAAGLEAVNIVWISIQFTEEHRAALDWLNRVTDEKLRFFGIELDVYKIGDSIPAPKFEIVSKPNDWAKTVKSARKSSEELTETKALYVEYWQALKEYLEQYNSRLKSQKPQPQHWTYYALGKSDCKLAATASVRDHFIRVEFNLTGSLAKDRYDEMFPLYSEDSKMAIHENIFWDRLDERQMSLVGLKSEADLSDRSDWPNQFNWYKEHLEKFDSFFRPKVKKLEI